MNRQDKYAAHELLRNETRLALQKAFPSISIYTRHIGMFYIRRISKGAIFYNPIQIEKKGRCDDWFVLPCQINNFVFPIHGEMETKSGNAVLNHDQIKWRDKCFRKGILWFENRNAQETINNINKELNKRGLVVLTISN